MEANDDEQREVDQMPGVGTLAEDDERCAVALLLIDVINDLDFPEGEALLEHALPMAERIAELKTRARSCGIPVIYVNDNFGRWRSDLHTQVERCLQPDVRGRPIVERLHPEPEDYFILKPRHSAFFGTSLELLLERLGVSSLILTGLAGNICVFFTANDAYLRELRVIVPGDCIASNSPKENEQSLQQMERVLKADIRPSREWTVERLRELTLQSD